MSVVLGLLIERSRSLGLDLQSAIDSGDLFIQQIDAAELSPGEFTAKVRACIDTMGARTVVIDSLNGYQAAMPEEHFLLLHIHELLQFLNRYGATTFLTMAYIVVVNPAILGNAGMPVAAVAAALEPRAVPLAPLACGARHRPAPHMEMCESESRTVQHQKFFRAHL